MFSFPPDFTISIRKPAPTIRNLVRFVVPGWQGTRLNVQYALHAHIRITGNGSPRVKLLQLYDGRVDDPVIIELSPRASARSAERRMAIRGVSGSIDPGQAVVMLEFPGRSRDMNTAHPTLYLHTLTSEPDAQAELAVARDAFQAGDHDAAGRIARKTIPLTAALFMTMLDHEVSYLKRTTEGSAYQ